MKLEYIARTAVAVACISAMQPQEAITQSVLVNAAPRHSQSILSEDYGFRRLHYEISGLEQELRFKEYSTYRSRSNEIGERKFNQLSSLAARYGYRIEKDELRAYTNGEDIIVQYRIKDNSTFGFYPMTLIFRPNDVLADGTRKFRPMVNGRLTELPTVDYGFLSSVTEELSFSEMYSFVRSSNNILKKLTPADMDRRFFVEYELREIASDLYALYGIKGTYNLRINASSNLLIVRPESDWMDLHNRHVLVISGDKGDYGKATLTEWEHDYWIDSNTSGGKWVKNNFLPRIDLTKK